MTYVDQVRDAFAAQAAGDLEPARKLLGSDAILNVPAFLPIGDPRGFDGLVALMLEMMSRSDGGFASMLTDAIGAGEIVTTINEVNATRNGRSINYHTVWTFGSPMASSRKRGYTRHCPAKRSGVSTGSPKRERTHPTERVAAPNRAHRANDISAIRCAKGLSLPHIAGFGQRQDPTTQARATDSRSSVFGEGPRHVWPFCSYLCMHAMSLGHGVGTSGERAALPRRLCSAAQPQLPARSRESG